VVHKEQTTEQLFSVVSIMFIRNKRFQFHMFSFSFSYVQKFQVATEMTRAASPRA
jgi:hypothetical protein